jgi:hypothetical protein
MPTNDKSRLAEECAKLDILEDQALANESFAGEYIPDEELERRWQAFERNPDEGEPWEDAKRSLLSE